MSCFRVANTALTTSPGLHWPLDSAALFEATTTLEARWTVRRGDLAIEVPPQEMLFDSKGSWAAYRGQAEGVTEFVQFGVQEGQRFPQARMRIDDPSREVEVNWLDEIGWTFPFDELFFLNAFSLQNTILLHSMSCLVGESGFLFCGVSGAGKSTLGAILENAGVQLLCDERNAATITDSGTVIMSSTPFYGTSGKSVPGSALLKSIVVLDPQHQGLSLSRLDTSEGVAEVFPTLFLPQFSRSKIDASLNTFAGVLESTPVFRLSYDKAKADVVAFLQSELFCQG